MDRLGNGPYEDTIALFKKRPQHFTELQGHCFNLCEREGWVGIGS
jgi:hypothetical protein